MPVGMITAYSGAADGLPIGWLACDGSEVSRTTYADLFAAVGVTYGVGDGSTTFNLPDMRGLTVVGTNEDALPNFQSTDPDLSAYSVADSSGAEDHQLAINEMPSHSHTYNQPISVTGIDLDIAGGRPVTIVGGNTNSAGSDQPHNNMMPFVVMTWMIKF